MFEKDVKIPDVETPTADGVLDQVVEFVTGNTTFVSIVIVTILVVITVKALGGAFAGVAGRLTIPIGIAMLVAFAIGASMLMK